MMLKEYAAALAWIIRCKGGLSPGWPPSERKQWSVAAWPVVRLVAYIYQESQLKVAQDVIVLYRSMIGETNDDKDVGPDSSSSLRSDS